MGSEKAKEFENYKLEAEQRLEKTKQEYSREEQNLQLENEREISDLRSAISILENTKETSQKDIDNLRSLLRSKDVKIKSLEEESERLNDLHTSLKSIDSSNRKQYNKKLSEVEDQKNKLETEKKKLEQKIRKYISSETKQNEENAKLKEEKEKLLSQMEKLNKEAKTDRRKVTSSLNEFTRLQEELKTLKTSVLDVTREKEAVEEREKLLKQEIKYRDERIQAKDTENTEYIEKSKEFNKEKQEFNRKEKTFQQNIKDKDEKIREKNVTMSRQREELEELRKKKEKLEDDIDKEKFKKSQFDRLQADYNFMVEELNNVKTNAVYDKDQLEEELRETQRKLQELQESYIDSKDYESMLRDNRDLSKTIDLLEQDVRQTTRVVNDTYDEKTAIERKYKKSLEDLKKKNKDFESYKKKIHDSEEKNKDKIREDLRKIRRNYNDQLAKKDFEFKKERENFKFQLSQRLRPGEIKSVQILLNNLSLDNLDEEDYREAYIKYKTSRDNFLKKSEDEKLPRVERLMYEELKKLADIRLDLLNMSFNRPAKTEAGKEFVRRTDQTLAGKFYRFRKSIAKYLAGTTLGAGLMGVVYMIYDFLRASASVSRSVASYGYKTIAPTASKAAAHIGKAFLNAGKKTQAAIALGAAYFVDRSHRYGIGDTISSILNIIGRTIGFGGEIIDRGFEGNENVVKAGVDTVKFVADNTTTVFLLIISAIGIMITLKYSRK